MRLLYVMSYCTMMQMMLSHMHIFLVLHTALLLALHSIAKPKVAVP